MKKRAISLFLAISMSFSLFYPSLSLNDNVLQCTREDDLEDGVVVLDGQEVSLLELMRAKESQKTYKLKLWEWLSEICQ